MGCVGIHHTEITGLYTAEQDINQLAIGIHHQEITGLYTTSDFRLGHTPPRNNRVIYRGVGYI